MPQIPIFWIKYVLLVCNEIMFWTIFRRMNPGKVSRRLAAASRHRACRPHQGEECGTVHRVAILTNMADTHPVPRAGLEKPASLKQSNKTVWARLLFRRYLGKVAERLARLIWIHSVGQLVRPQARLVDLRVVTTMRGHVLTSTVPAGSLRIRLPSNWRKPGRTSGIARGETPGKYTRKTCWVLLILDPRLFQCGRPLGLKVQT